MFYILTHSYYTHCMYILYYTECIIHPHTLIQHVLYVYMHTHTHAIYTKYRHILHIIYIIYATIYLTSELP